MQLPPQLRHLARWSAALLIAAATTAVLSLAGTKEATAGMVYLVIVVWTATQAGMALSLFTALLCAFCFDFFFLPPFHTFVLAGPQEWVSFCSFIVTSYVAGRVAERARRQAQQAEQRREDVERLYTLSKEMMLYEDASGLMADLPRIIQRVFALETVALFVHDRQQLFASGGELPMGIEASLNALSSPNQVTQSIPGEMIGMPLLQGMRPVGALAWKPATLSREVAGALGAQVAIALARVLAIEASTRLEAQRESERLRGALIDSLTHELRTPLTSIRAAATTLVQGEGLDEAARRDLAAIVDEESTRLDALIGEAVEMAELDAKVVQVRAVPQHPRELLERAVERSHSALVRHSVAVVLDDPDRICWFDPQLLARVLRHLLENAARYSPPGSRIVLRSKRDAARLQFSVEDNGPGVDPIDLPLIFEKFYRGKKSAGKGTGMGLAIARAIVEAHGGEIEVTSTPGHGATFRFWIPLAEKEPTGTQKSE